MKKGGVRFQQSFKPILKKTFRKGSGCDKFADFIESFFPFCDSSTSDGGSVVA